MTEVEKTFKVSDLLNDMKKFTEFNPTQVAIVVGAAVTGIAAVANTYDVLFGVNKAVKECEQDDDTNKILKTRFIVFLVLSSLAIVLGIVLGVLTRGNWKMTALGLSMAGIAGIVFSLYNWYQYSTFSTTVRLGGSWGLLAVFIVLGFIFGTSGFDKDQGILMKTLPSS
jgi:uncharacterized membrane protein